MDTIGYLYIPSWIPACKYVPCDAQNKNDCFSLRLISNVTSLPFFLANDSPNDIDLHQEIYLVYSILENELQP